MKRATPKQAFPKPSRKERRRAEREDREQAILETAHLRAQAWLRAAAHPRFARDRGRSPPPYSEVMVSISPVSRLKV